MQTPSPSRQPSQGRTTPLARGISPTNSMSLCSTTQPPTAPGGGGSVTSTVPTSVPSPTPSSTHRLTAAGGGGPDTAAGGAPTGVELPSICSQNDSLPPLFRVPSSGPPPGSFPSSQLQLHVPSSTTTPGHAAGSGGDASQAAPPTGASSTTAAGGVHKAYQNALSAAPHAGGAGLELKLPMPSALQNGGHEGSGHLNRLHTASASAGGGTASVPSGALHAPCPTPGSRPNSHNAPLGTSAPLPDVGPTSSTSFCAASENPSNSSRLSALPRLLVSGDSTTTATPTPTPTNTIVTPSSGSGLGDGDGEGGKVTAPLNVAVPHVPVLSSPQSSSRQDGSTSPDSESADRRQHGRRKRVIRKRTI